MDKAFTLSSANDYGSLSAGLNAASGQPLDVNRDEQVAFVVSGTFTGASVEPYLKTRSGTWVPVGVVDKGANIAVSAGAIAVADSTAKIWTARFPAGLFVDAKLELTAIGTGDVVAEITSGRVPPGGEAIVVPVVSASTFSAGITFNGATGVNVVSAPDNLASALVFKEGANAYLTMVTTDGSEGWTFAKSVTLASGTDLIFSGTTGQSEVTCTDNLADALSFKITGGADFLVFDSTNSAEKILLGSSGQFLYTRTAGAPCVKLTAATITTAGAGTYTAAQLIGGLILRDPTGADRADTTHTAAQLVTALPGVAVGDVFDLMIVNTADAAETITLTAGAGVTLVPATITVAQNEVFIGKVRFTNVTGSSEAVTIYGGNVSG